MWITCVSINLRLYTQMRYTCSCGYRNSFESFNDAAQLQSICVIIHFSRWFTHCCLIFSLIYSNSNEQNVEQIPHCTLIRRNRNELYFSLFLSSSFSLPLSLIHSKYTINTLCMDRPLTNICELVAILS